MEGLQIASQVQLFLRIKRFLFGGVGFIQMSNLLAECWYIFIHSCRELGTTKELLARNAREEGEEGD